MYKYLLLLLGFGSAFIIGCKGSFFQGESKDPVIARVGEKNLFKSQISELVHEGTSATDSAAIVDGYVQNWIRENLMIREAEKNIAADINLNKLVDDYRSSLLVYNFETKIIESQLDTLVSEAEKQAFYNVNKTQYVLSHPILKCIIAKLPAKSKDVSTLRNALGKSDLTEAMFLIKEKAVYHQIDTSAFFTAEELNSLVPNNMLEGEKLAIGKIYQKKVKDYEYFVKILKYYDENKIAPFEFIKAKIDKTILSERKIELLQTYRQSLYEKSVANKDFEIFKTD